MLFIYVNRPTMILKYREKEVQIMSQTDAQENKGIGRKVQAFGSF